MVGSSIAEMSARHIHVAHIFRRLTLVVIFGCVLFLCRWLSYQLRFDFNVPERYENQLWHHWHWAIAVELVWLLVFRQFSGIYKYFSLLEIRRLAYAMVLSGLTFFSIRLFDINFSPPRSVILVQCMSGFLALGAVRTAWRMFHEGQMSRSNGRRQPKRQVAIIGAGDAGAKLIQELSTRSSLGLVAIAFFDDNPRKWGFEIHGIPVVGPPEQVPHKKAELGFEEVVIAMPGAPTKRIGEVVALLQQAGLKYVTVPSIDQLASGVVRISQLRPVNIEDLLGREPVDLRLDEIREVLQGRTVLVTGAGGSIGSELCRQVASFRPRRLVLVEQSEVQMFQIEQQLIKLGHGAIIVPVVADILDRPRMEAVFEEHQPSVVFHAAAHKHVPMMEIQPGEAIKNNSLATAYLAEMADDYGVDRFVMVSTDKAVNPTSVMGASKRLAEIFLQSYAREHSGRTRFITVRFGNVLGSSGSVVPIFERQISEGGPITVTHPDVVRYFMTIPEAAGLVLQSCAQGNGGEIFVLDMGQPVKIVELARQMIELSGLEPGRDIEIKFTGLRPGEKLFEELQHLQANCSDTSHPRIKRLTSEPATLLNVHSQLRWLSQKLHFARPDEVKLMLKQILPEYIPSVSPVRASAGPPNTAIRVGDLLPDMPLGDQLFPTEMADKG